MARTKIAMHPSISAIMPPDTNVDISGPVCPHGFAGIERQAEGATFCSSEEEEEEEGEEGGGEGAEEKEEKEVKAEEEGSEIKEEEQGQPQTILGGHRSVFAPVSDKAACAPQARGVPLSHWLHAGKWAFQPMMVSFKTMLVVAALLILIGKSFFELFIIVVL